MLQPTTEQRIQSDAIDAQSVPLAAAALLETQSAAITAVQAVIAEIDRGAQLMAAAIRSGRSLTYAAAGSSGLMALADACELPGTFGIPAHCVHIHMAGGVPTTGQMPGDTEDDAGAADIALRDVMPGDVVIVLSASGTTPYALALAKSGKANGASVIAIANNPETPLLEMADVPICVATPPEVIAGSTRLAAGTGQKVALNLMSSLMGIKLGHVYQGMMVNVVADNAKLIKRAIGIVRHIADVSAPVAKAALAQTQGNPKAAILVAKGCSPLVARTLLQRHDGHLAPCLKALEKNKNT